MHQDSFDSYRNEEEGAKARQEEQARIAKVMEELSAAKEEIEMYRKELEAQKTSHEDLLAEKNALEVRHQQKQINLEKMQKQAVVL